MKIIAKLLKFIKDIIRKIQKFTETKTIKEEIPQELYERWKNQLDNGKSFKKENKTKKLSLQELWEDYRK